LIVTVGACGSMTVWARTFVQLTFGAVKMIARLARRALGSICEALCSCSRVPIRACAQIWHACAALLMVTRIARAIHTQLNAMHGAIKSSRCITIDAGAFVQ